MSSPFEEVLRRAHRDERHEQLLEGDVRQPCGPAREPRVEREQAIEDLDETRTVSTSSRARRAKWSARLCVRSELTTESMKPSRTAAAGAEQDRAEEDEGVARRDAGGSAGQADAEEGREDDETREGEELQPLLGREGERARDGPRADDRARRHQREPVDARRAAEVRHLDHSQTHSSGPRFGPRDFHRRRLCVGGEKPSSAARASSVRAAAEVIKTRV